MLRVTGLQGARTRGGRQRRPENSVIAGPQLCPGRNWRLRCGSIAPSDHHAARRGFEFMPQRVNLDGTAIGSRGVVEARCDKRKHLSAAAFPSPGRGMAMQYPCSCARARLTAVLTPKRTKRNRKYPIIFVLADDIRLRAECKSGARCNLTPPRSCAHAMPYRR